MLWMRDFKLPIKILQSNSTKNLLHPAKRHCLTYFVFNNTLIKTFKSQSSMSKMAKSKLHKEGAGTQLRHIKQRKLMGHRLPVPGTMNIQVIGAGGRGSPKAVLLVTEHYRYLFNCGECTQRIMSEQKMKPSRIEHIFITHKSWQNIGGLLGMALTMQANMVPHMTIHGPKNVERIVALARGYSELQHMSIYKSDLNNSVFKDVAFSIEYVPVSISLLSNQESNDSPVTKKRRLSEGTESTCSITETYGTAGSSRNDDEAKNKTDVAVSYICRPSLYPKKLDVDTCKKLGVPFGPLMGQLKQGRSITMPNGTVIHPEDVLSEQMPSFPIAVVDCPEESFLDAFVAHHAWDKLVTENPEIVVHFTSQKVSRDKRYENWLKRFPTTTRHIVLDGTDDGLVSAGIYCIQAKLNLLHDQIFPLLPLQTSKQTKLMVKDDTRFVQGATNLTYHIRPRNGFDCENCIDLDNDQFIKEAMDLEAVENSLKTMKTSCLKIQKEELKGREYPEVVFLGTGSSVPSKVRNVSAILLHLCPEKTLLLDCGEGTLAQIWRHYGDETPHILRRIKGIFISHMHADHHMGLFNVIYARQQVVGDQDDISIPVLAPFLYQDWQLKYIYELKSHSENLSMELIPLKEIMVSEHGSPELYDNVIKMFDLKKINVVYVRHCKNAFGVAFEHNNGWKITYSGDTMPADALTKAGKESDILIHEATMEDGMEEDAKMKLHSTTSQAIDIGIQMKAKFILLNHFSQRYAKIPMFNERFSDKVGISFDNMRVTLDTLCFLPYFSEPLKLMFADSYADMEIRTKKRVVRQKALELAEYRLSLEQSDSKEKTLESNSRKAHTKLDNNSRTDNVNYKACSASVDKVS